eukprot:4152384-Prymnesium_polylepis.1
MAAPTMPPGSTCTAHGLAGKIWDRPPPANAPDDVGTPACYIRSAPSEARGVAAPFIAAAFSRGGEYLATLDKHGRIIVFHIHSNRYVVVRRGGAHGLALVFSQQRRAECFVSLENGQIECLDAETRALVGVLKGHAHGAREL